MILDSTFIHDVVREKPAAANKLDDLIDTGSPIAISTVAVFEVGVGLRGTGAQHEQRFDETVDTLHVVPLGATEARRALNLQRELYDRGEPIGARDVLIAGTAVERDEDVLTHNVDEFGRIDALGVETY